MVDEQIIRLNVRAWGCKIKSKIEASVLLESNKIEQGDLLKPKIIFEFDSDDLPTSIEVTLEQTKALQPFKLDSPIRTEVTGSTLELEVPLDYSSGETGLYKVEVNFRHAEYGTEIIPVQPAEFKLISPEVEIRYCKSDKPKVSKGQDFEIVVGLNYPAPQKLRGILYGRLISTDELVNRLYELEPKRTSIIGEKEFMWHLKVPHNETNTGKLKAIIEFKSKDTISKKDFEDLLEVRQSKLLQVNTVECSRKLVSPNDEITLNAELVNIGLEKLSLEINLEFIKTDLEKGEKEIIKDTISKWPSDAQKIELEPDDSRSLNFITKIPDNVKFGKYRVDLYWRDFDTGEIEHHSQDMFEVREHHEIKILNAVPGSNIFSPGTDGSVKILILDNGTRAGEELDVECRIFDIFHQEVYNITSKMKFSPQAAEFDLNWPIPGNFESGKYDLSLVLKSGEEELAKRKFSKLINVELPVRLEVHLMLPSPISSPLGTEHNKYLLENEKLIGLKDYQKLTVCNLNSNTHLYLLDNNLIVNSLEKPSKPADLKQFINLLFSYFTVQEYLENSTFNDDLDYWSKVGYCWTNLVLMDENILKGEGISDVKLSGKRKLGLSTWFPIARGVFKNTLKKGSKSLILNKNVFHNNVLKNKEVTSSIDFQLVTSILGYLMETKVKQGVEIISQSKILQPAVLDELKQIIQLAGILYKSQKFRKVSNSKQLEKKFNKLLTSWLSEARRSRILKNKNKKKFELLSSGYHYLLLYLATEITKKLKLAKQNKNLDPLGYNRILSLGILYYYVLIHYNKARVKFDPYFGKNEQDSLNEELGQVVLEIKKIVTRFWDIHNKWQTNYINYLNNMKSRSNIAFIHEHVKISINPVIFRSMRGAQTKGKLILGNNGSSAVKLDSYLGLPSSHWDLAVPGAQISSNLYNLKTIKIPPKQTIEIPIRISFPNSLSFSEYKAIFKLKPKPFELLPESI
jgi:hypothetical protein